MYKNRHRELKDNNKLVILTFFEDRNKQNEANCPTKSRTQEGSWLGGPRI